MQAPAAALHAGARAGQVLAARGLSEEVAGGQLHYGPPLGKDLENAPWGTALANGLRVACLLELRAAELELRLIVDTAASTPADWTAMLAVAGWARS